jgi:uncharacterized protein (DUF3084 family)
MHGAEAMSGRQRDKARRKSLRIRGYAVSARKHGFCRPTLERTKMVNNGSHTTFRRSVNQGLRADIQEPNKIKASAPSTTVL